jgi:hypothetical protein
VEPPKDGAGTVRIYDRRKQRPQTSREDIKNQQTDILQRCRSDTLETDARKNRSANKLDSIKRKETPRSSNNKLTKSSSAVLDNAISKKGADALNENRKSRSYNENSFKGEEDKCKRNSLHDLKKSRSDVLELKGKRHFSRENC